MSAVTAVAQTQLTRLKEQMEGDVEGRQGQRAEESRSAELCKRLQRQVRDLEEELGEVKRRETDALLRKSSLVSR